MTGRIEIATADATSPDALVLIRLLSAELTERYDFTDDGSGAFDPSDAQGPRAAFVIARVDGRPVGCGALRPMDAPGFKDSAEIKRMYVAPAARGRRLGALVLERLEAMARDFGYARTVLETGTRQPEAIRLYERDGYVRIPPYGEYAENPHSVCFAKVLAIRCSSPSQGA